MFLGPSPNSCMSKSITTHNWCQKSWYNETKYRKYFLYLTLSFQLGNQTQHTGPTIHPSVWVIVSEYTYALLNQLHWYNFSYPRKIMSIPRLGMSMAAPLKPKGANTHQRIIAVRYCASSRNSALIRPDYLHVKIFHIEGFALQNCQTYNWVLWVFHIPETSTFILAQLENCSIKQFTTDSNFSFGIKS